LQDGKKHVVDIKVKHLDQEMNASNCFTGI